MIRRPPRSSLYYTRFPYTTLLLAIDHPGAAYQQRASRFAVARQFTADVINRLQIDAERWPALLRRQFGLGVSIKRKMLGLECVDGAQWRQLGHAPGVLKLDAVLRREC